MTLLGQHVQSDLDQILIDRERIAARVVELAEEICRDLDAHGDGGEVVLMPILTGSIVFVADLIRQMPQKLRIEVITVTSYPGRTTSSRGAEIIGSVTQEIEGRHVLVIDDILDSGETLKAIRAELLPRRPKSLRTCVLLRKQRSSALETPCDYVGFDIPDVFVVGYGLDYNNYYRNLPDIGTLKEEAL